MSSPAKHSRWTRESNPDSSHVFITKSSSAKEVPPAPTCFEKFQSAVNKCRNVNVSIIFNVIFIIVILILSVRLVYYQGSSVSSNHQKDVTNCLPDICPPDWIGHQGQCYKLSKEEKNWMESQEYCISQNASLAKITKEEMDFVTKLIRKLVFWIGLRIDQDQLWKWPDGEIATLKVMGNGSDCAFLNDDGTANVGRCSTEHRYICKKNHPKRS